LLPAVCALVARDCLLHARTLRGRPAAYAGSCSAGTESGSMPSLVGRHICSIGSTLRGEGRGSGRVAHPTLVHDKPDAFYQGLQTPRGCGASKGWSAQGWVSGVIACAG